MENASVEVRSNRAVVGTAKYLVYASTAEAVEHEGEEKLLGILNAQIRTNAMNAVRSLANPSVSKVSIRMEVMSGMSTEDVLAFAGNKAGLQEYVEAEADHLYAERKHPVSVATDGDDEADEDEE